MKVNLETLLINQNRKLATPTELLLIKEYEKHSSFVENDALSRVGLGTMIKVGKILKESISKKQQQTKNFKQERVFHVSQIKAICEKYYLRFLDSTYYKGTIDKDLPTKITNFEAAYNVKCDNSNTKICAPPESFNLEERPKDPLFFYKINDEYYYLIHKWGNDLSVFRRCRQALTNTHLCIFITSIIFPIPFLAIPDGLGLGLYILISTWSIAFNYLRNFFWVLREDECMRFVKRNDWESTYIN